MKTRLFFLLFLGVISNLFFSFASEDQQTKNYASCIENQTLELDRLYVLPEEVLIDANGICIIIEGAFYQVSQICHDAQGLYVPFVGYWKYCSNGHPNHPWRLRCKVCKEPL